MDTNFMKDKRGTKRWPLTVVERHCGSTSVSGQKKKRRRRKETKTIDANRAKFCS
jgi:hypothetical protein